MNARNYVARLALKGKSIGTIRKRLERRGMGGELHIAEINRIANEAKAAKGMRGHRRTLWPYRVFGGFAMLFGLGGVLLFGKGLGLLVLGGILFIGPGMAWEKVPSWRLSIWD